MLRILTALVVILLSWPTLAQNQSSPESATAVTAEGRDHAEAVSGVGYTVISRVFLGDDGNLSYLRFLNLSGTPATVTARIFGTPSGRDYGSVDTTIPDNASRQLSITQILNSANIQGLTSPDTRLSLYLRSTNTPVAVQHVLYSSLNGFFENLSVCQNSSLSDGNSALINVHTSRIPDYTSYIDIHNYGTTTATYDLEVYESESGQSRGSLPVSIEPNTTFEQPFSYIEDQLGWAPGSTVFHANVEAFPRSGTRGAIVSHFVYNAKLAAYLNLTNYCTIEATANNLPVAVSDNISGASIGKPYSIDLSTLITNDQNATGATLLEATTARSNGTANGTVVQSGNTITYTPAQRGIAVFQYRIHTAAGDSNYANVTVNIGGGAPVANSDTLTQQFSVGRSSLIVLSTLTANDTDATGATLDEFSSPSSNGITNGTLTRTDGGNLSYTPAQNGTVTFTYKIRTSAGVSGLATVTLTVGDLLRPVANDDTYTPTGACPVGQAFTISLLALTANDENASGATLRDFTQPRTGSLTGPVNGSLVQVGNNLSLTLSSRALILFQYRIANSAGESNFATMALNCEATAPVARPDTLTRTFPVSQATTFGLSALIENDTNATGATLETFSAPQTNGSPNGIMTKSGNDLTYTPAREGTVTFDYSIRTAGGVSNTATVTLTAGGSGSTTTAPVAVDDTLTQSFSVGTQSSISLSTLLANDRNTTGVTLISVGTPTTDGTANGTLAASGDRILYTPTRDGRVVFDYTIGNNAGRSTARVSLTVSASGPIAVNDTLTQTFTVGTRTSISYTTLIANDRNATGANLDNVGTPITDGSANGTLARSGNELVYTPARAGTVTFEYRIRTSAGQSNAATVTLTVSGNTRPAPVANNDNLVLSFRPGQATQIPLSLLLANDQNIDGFTIESLGTPVTEGTANGTITRLEGSLLSYTPARAGRVTFEYRIRTAGGTSNAATVTLTVSTS